MMLDLRLKSVIITSAGLFVSPEETVTEETQHDFNQEMVDRFITGSPSFLKIDNRNNGVIVPSGINRETIEQFFNELVDAHFRLPGNVEEFIDELVAGKLGYAKLRRGKNLYCFNFASFGISKFIQRIEI